MAGEQFRTTISLVYWAADPTGAQGIADAVNDALPAGDRKSTLVQIQYVADGKPDDLLNLYSLDPSGVDEGADDVTMRALGDGYTDDCVISFNGEPVPTEFVSSQELTAIVKPVDVGAGGFPVYVKRGGSASSSLTFVVLAPPPEA